MPAHRLISLAEAVRRYTLDGMQYASGAALPIGSDAIVFGRELLRQRRSKLHAIFHCNSQQLNLLAAAGAVDKVECGFSGLEVFGFANGLRRAVESGQTALEDYSNLAMALRLLGGALPAFGQSLRKLPQTLGWTTLRGVCHVDAAAPARRYWYFSKNALTRP